MLFSRTDYETYEHNNDRSLLFHGLGLTLQRFPALLWAFVFNLFYAVLSTVRIAASVGAITDHSLAVRSLHHGFDLGTLAAIILKFTENKSFSPGYGAPVILYLGTYFLLIPGTLLCYQTDTPARLSTLLRAGILHFWRFVRILILSLIVMGLILGPLAVAYSKYSDYLDRHVLGSRGFLCNLAGILVLALVAAVLRLYFDLVEVYTIQIGLQTRPNGKPDRRVRRTLFPALHALGNNFFRAYSTFILLSILGIAAFALTTRFDLHSLAKPRVWPSFLVTQAGLFLMLLTRFWQRGAETTLSLDYPIFEEEPIPTTRASFIPVYVPPPAPIVDPAPAPTPLEPSAEPPVSILPSDPAPMPVEPPLEESADASAEEGNPGIS